MNYLTIAWLLVRRALGCRIVGHEWHYYAESSPLYLAIDHRVCRIAACQVHQVWRRGRWVETEVGRPGL